MTVWRKVQDWNTEGQPAELTILVGDPAPQPECGSVCEYHVDGLLRRSPPKLARGANLAEARDAARHAGAAEIVFYNSYWADDAPLSQELDPAYVKMCRIGRLAFPLAEQGWVHAQCIVGLSFFLTDYTKAEYWLRLAADAGCPQACGTLADLLCFSPLQARERSYYAARALEYGFPEELRGRQPPFR
jgi:hypothetical protein